MTSLATVVAAYRARNEAHHHSLAMACLKPAAIALLASAPRRVSCDDLDYGVAISLQRLGLVELRDRQVNVAADTASYLVVRS